jgi:hypothetical protein
LQLPNSILISLPMHCFHCRLTCLTSQALLQAVLDKEPRDFIGSIIQHEFSSLPVYMTQCHSVATDRELLSTGTGSSGMHHKSHQDQDCETKSEDKMVWIVAFVVSLGPFQELVEF